MFHYHVISTHCDSYNMTHTWGYGSIFNIDTSSTKTNPNIGCSLFWGSIHWKVHVIICIDSIFWILEIFFLTQIKWPRIVTHSRSPFHRFSKSFSKENRPRLPIDPPIRNLQCELLGHSVTVTLKVNDHSCMILGVWSLEYDPWILKPYDHYVKTLRSSNWKYTIIGYFSQ